jgi:hypothetical protein
VRSVKIAFMRLRGIAALTVREFGGLQALKKMRGFGAALITRGRETRCFPANDSRSFAG